MNKFTKQILCLAIASLVITACSKDDDKKGGAQNPAQAPAPGTDQTQSDLSVAQKKVTYPAVKGTALGGWRAFETTAEDIKIEMNMYINNQEATYEAVCTKKNGEILVASVVSKIVLTDSTLENLEDKESQVKSKTSDSTCTSSVAKGKFNYTIQADDTLLGEGQDPIHRLY